MRKLSANYIYTGNGKVLKNGIIRLSDTGKILEIIDTQGELKEENGLEFYNGVLVPGFVNVHCHLELSYMKGHVAKHTSLPGFIKELQSKRNNFDESQIVEAIQKADKKMKNNGIVAVGDISNDHFTIKTKLQSPIKYINFIEVFSSDKNKAHFAFAKAKKLQEEFKQHNLNAHIVPHAPYSISIELFELIRKNAETENAIVSIHNQETESENDFFAKRSGKMYDFFSSWGIDMSYIDGNKASSILNYAPKLPKQNKTLLIHNTYSSTEDIEFAQNHFEECSWGLCPNANLYIENKLPEINNFRKKRANICLGTDSYASNDKLCILSELIELQRNFPFVSFTESLKWASINGAKALGLENEIGSIEVGKKPGINLISNFDFKNLCLKANSEVKVLC